MKSPIHRSGAQPDSRSPPDRKRKRTQRPSIPEEPRRKQQQVASFHRSPADHNPRPSGSTFDSPPPKAARPSVIESPISLGSHRPGSSKMYSFPSRIPSGNGVGVIDLTGSPHSTSPTPRINGRLPHRSGLNPHTGAKKLVVKNLKTNTNWDSKAYLEKIWKQLDEALDNIFSDSNGTFSKEELYRGVENVSRQGGASVLFSRLDAKCKLHLEKSVRDDLLQNYFDSAARDNVRCLQAILERWSQWTTQMATIRSIFFFLDRSYLLLSTKPTLVEFTPQLFREIVFNHEQIKHNTIQGACDLVAADRTESKLPNEQSFQQAVHMFHELVVYTSVFEPQFLASTQSFASQWSVRTMETKSLAEYVKLAHALIAKEIARCDQFSLDTSTKREELAMLEYHLIESKEAWLTEKVAVADLLDNNASSDLAALYSLLNRRRLGEKLRTSFEKWVDDTGTSIVLSKDEDNMVIHLLSLKRRLDEIWNTPFQRNEALGHGLRESFEIFMNKTKASDATWGTDNAKVGEMIAKYVNQLLRGGVKAIPELLTARRSSSISMPNGQRPTLTVDDDNKDSDVDEDAEVNLQLDQVLDLFRFLHGKAVFEAFYKKDLARRLLMGRSASADAERSMLTRLKTECGSGFTHNLEQMFKDIELAREEMQAYKQRVEDRIGYEKGKNVDLNVNILSAAAWPTYPEIPVVIPDNVKRAIDDFELHYKSKHSGRKLDWKHALAHCQIKATFGKVSKELVVSSFQAIVLLLFNGVSPEQHLTYNHILTETGLPEQEVKRTLQSLACAQLRPLTKHPRGKEINTTDTFTINQDFTHPKYRVKINQVQLKETKEENKETHIRVADDRNFECQAAIVRILKSRKTISHSELISETIKATMSRGVLAVSDIKKNIDRLIEKDYMEREDDNMYSYIA